MWRYPGRSIRMLAVAAFTLNGCDPVHEPITLPRPKPLDEAAVPQHQLTPSVAIPQLKPSPAVPPFGPCGA